ncbi:MAG: superoxide dismutase family protein [Acidobacteria bacterium]|nr:MAG: superoxide dismutase family protein [Acidobacteriota bacterium]
MKRVAFSILLLLVTTPMACRSSSTNQTREPQSSRPSAPKITKAIAVVHPTKGYDVHGVVTFTQTPDGIRVVADIQNLEPGAHGFHIHEFGDCSAEDGTSAGGHFNPTGMPHGGRNAEKRHVGDLGNITADASGRAKVEFVDAHLSFEGPNSIIGRAVIIHAGADDLKSQPSGAAGPRVACGVIGIAKP